MCLKHPKSASKVPSKVVRIDWTDHWNSDLLHAVGTLLISSAQLEYEVYIVAKRKDGKGLLKWMLEHPDQIFGRYCCWLEKNYSKDKALMALTVRARSLWKQRNGYVHAVWGLRRGKPVRRRNFKNAGISVHKIRTLTKRVRKMRDDFEALVPA